MGQKLVVPLTMLVLAISAGVAIYFLLQADTPRPAPAPAGNSTVADTPQRDSTPLSPLEFDVSRLQPDPVLTDKPHQPFSPAKDGLRMVISGRVLDDSGVGVADARVLFTGAQKLHLLRGSGYTDAAGNYRLLAWSTLSGHTAGEPAGRVSAEAPDGRLTVGDQTPVTEGDSFEMPDLTLASGATLEGQVITSDGAPAAGVIVTVRSGGPVFVHAIRGREPNSGQRQHVTSVTANETGRFSFRNLPPAKYQLSADAGYFGVNVPTPDVDLISARYLWQDLRLEGGSHVRGTVRDRQGNPIAGAVVQLVLVRRDAPPETPPVNSPARLEAVRDLRERVTDFRNDTTALATQVGKRRSITDAAGRYGFSNVQAGEYRLESKLGASEALMESVQPGQPDYDLQLDANSSLSGTVLDAQTGLPVEFYDVRVVVAAQPGEVTPFERVSADGRFGHHPGGRYALLNPTLREGVVRVSAAGYMPATLKFGPLAEGDMLSGLDISLKPLCRLSFELVREGRRLDLEPVALLFEGMLAYEASSDERGRVRIPDVAPATYNVTVFLADGSKLVADVVVPAAREAELQVAFKPAG